LFKGDKSNIENSTDHFCEDTRQNALAAHANLGHVTHFNCVDPSLKLPMEHINVFLCVAINASPLRVFFVMLFVTSDITNVNAKDTIL